MKPLRSLTMRQRTCGRWALLGGTLLWMGVSFTSPAHAVPTNYEIDPGGDFTGTFTFDSAITGSAFTDWTITGHYPGEDVLYSPAFSTEPVVNLRNPATGQGFLLQSSGGAERFRFQNGDPTVGALSYLARANINTELTIEDCTQGGSCTYHEVRTQTVPEPAAAVLLAIGLLVLAGSRWLPGRGARQRLG